MSDRSRRIVRWVGYLTVAAGFASWIVAVAALIGAITGLSGDRGLLLALTVGAVGSGFANVLIGVPLLTVGRSRKDSPKVE